MECTVERSCINEHLYKILEKISYPKLNIQKLCRERSDLDDVYVTALFEYCLFKNTGKRLEEVGCIYCQWRKWRNENFPTV